VIKVLFVCLGNICRSPMAEAVFQEQVRQAGLDNAIEIDSAGTGSWHIGETAHPGTLDVLRRQGIAYNGRARQIRRSDLEQYDYVLTMDRSNLHDVRRMAGDSRAEIRLFLSYAHEAGLVTEEQVPDPYYDDRFDYVYNLVSKGSQALLAHIRARHQL